MIKRVHPFEEALYEQVANEIGNGLVKKGLWLKATVESNGDDHKAKSLYTQFRIAQLLEETARHFEQEKQRESNEENHERVRMLSVLRAHRYAVKEEKSGACVLYEPSGECRRFPSFAALAVYANGILGENT